MRGAVLIITLWIMAILAILSIGIGGRMGLELKLTGFSRDSTAALYLAEAGVKRAIAVLQNEDHAVDSFNEKWSCNNEGLNPRFKGIKVGEAGTFTVSYHFSDNRVFYGVQDEERRININNAPRDVMSRLIAYLDPTIESPDEIAANIEDWRGIDALFDSVDEVLLVKGVDRNLFDKMKGYITVYPLVNSGNINVNTAPLPALKALGFSDEDAKAIMTYRAGNDGIEGTSDDTPFDRNAFAPYSAKLTADNAKLVSYGSQFFRIISTGSASGGRAFKTITCVVSGAGGDILFWNEE